MPNLKTFLAVLLLVAVPVTPVLAASKDADSAMETTVAPMPASGKKPTRKQVQAQWQRLIDQVLPLATTQVAKKASFYPFAAVQDTNGQIRVVSGHEHQATVTPAQALGALRKELSAMARRGQAVAALYLADAEVTRKDTGLRQTGIRLKLDHVSGQSMEGFLPYVRQEDGSLRLLTPEYRPSRNVTFP